MPEPIATFVWDAALGRYREPPLGRLVSEARIQGALRTVIQDSGERLAQLTAQQFQGARDLLEWRIAMARELRTSYGVASSLASGGLAQMGPRERGLLGATLRHQGDFLSRFALDLAQGRLTEAEALARARLYAGGAHSAYEAFRRRDAERRGHSQERNILGSGESCEQCRAESAKEWQPLGVLSLPGTRTCKSNCRCRLVTRVAPPAEEAA